MDRSQIKPGDRNVLQDLTDEFESCEIVLQATGRFGQLNNDDSVIKIMTRCPIYVSVRWQSRFQELSINGRDPNVRRGRTIKKRYAVSVTCFAIRSINIEIANSLHSDSFTH